MSKVIRSVRIENGLFPLEVRENDFPPVETKERQHGSGGKTVDQVELRRAVGADALARESVENARREAERVVADAVQQAEDVRRQAEKEGYEKGWKEAQEKAEQELALMREEMVKNIAESENSKQEMLRSSEDTVMELSMAIASKVVHGHVEANPAVVLNLAREALERAASAGYYMIFANPADIGLLEQYLTELQRGSAGKAQIHMFPDTSVSPGGCKIQTEGGLVDVTLESQLEEIRKALREGMR